MNFYLFLICLLGLGAMLRAQEPYFMQRDIGDENAGIALNAILQDHQSMIWLGSDKGLARYDGILYHPVSLDTNKDTRVTALMEDDRGRVWAGTAAGKIFYIESGRNVSLFDIEEGLPAKPITSMVIDHDGQLWFATYGEGVYVYTDNRLFNLDMDDGLAGNDIYDLELDASGEIWIATDDGINICSFQNENKNIRKPDWNIDLPDQIIKVLTAGSEGNMWIGTFEKGVVMFDKPSGKIIQPFENQLRDEITAIEIFDGKNVWIGTRKSGAWRYDPELKFCQKLTSLEKISNGEITGMLSDVEGNMWIITDDGMLFSAFCPIQTTRTEAGEIQTLLCDHRDQLWIGSKHGLYRLMQNPESNSTAVRMAPTYDFNITDLVEDRYHNLWIGTMDKGLFVFNPSTGHVKHIMASLLRENTIMSMDNSESEIWIATLQGVLYYPADRNILEDHDINFELISDPWKSQLNFVFQVFVDSRGTAWFATDGNGVYSIRHGKVNHFAGDSLTHLHSVYSICEDQRGHMWFNTPDIGIIEFDGEKYIPLGLEEGLGNIRIESIALAGTGDIIMSHNRGIDVMEPDRRHFMYYREEVNVREIEPGLNSIATNADGHVFISNKDRIIKYYAADNKLSIHPHTQIRQIYVYEKPADLISGKKFAYNQNYISFDYIGLWYTSPKSVNHLYKLEGYDRQWKESKDNVASYSNLPPGKYTFFVKASENKFFLDEPLASYSFQIGSPFWLQYWFIALMVILSASLFYWIVKARERMSERQATLQKDRIESQLQVLKAQINPHFLFNSFNTLITIIDENASRPGIAIEYVEKLSDFFRRILQYREQETISLEEEWELVQNYGYLLTKRYGSNLRIHMEDHPKNAFILPLTLQILVENAVKHNVITEKRPLDVYISVENDQYQYIIVKNNLQPKSNAEPSTQFGLQSIIKRYQLLTDKKVMVSQTDMYFIVKIPIIKQITE